MNAPVKKPIMSKSGSRMAESSLWLEMVRFEDSDKNPLWRFAVRSAARTSPSVTLDASVEVLLAVRQFTDEALSLLRTDGNRIPQEPDPR